MSSTITTSLTDSSNTITSTNSISVNSKNYHKQSIIVDPSFNC